MKQHKEYTDKLVQTHGPVHALKIVTDCLNIANRSFSTTFFEEAEFTINDKGFYEYAKNQSKKVEGKKANRMSKTKNFYTLVHKLLTKGIKNGEYKA